MGGIGFKFVERAIGQMMRKRELIFYAVHKTKRKSERGDFLRKSNTAKEILC